MRQHRCRGARSGLTLVQVITTTAIIAVIAVLLFPELFTDPNSSRVRVHEITCMDHLHRLGTALAIYTQDYDGWYPAAKLAARQVPPTVKEAESVNWAEMVYPYLPESMDNKKINYAHGVFHCPSDSGRVGPSYGMNAWFLCGLNVSQMKQPARTVIMAEKRASIRRESFVWWISPWPTWPWKEGTPITDRETTINAIGEARDESHGGTRNREIQEVAGLQTHRHPNPHFTFRSDSRSNWLMSDSHVKWMKLEQVWGNGTTENQLWPTR